jgi:predicted phage terminase large subunit-like protein
MLALTRLAQLVVQLIPGKEGKPDEEIEMIPRVFYDLNPTSKAHWSYRLFILKIDPDSKVALTNPANYAWMRINPKDNLANLTSTYMDTLNAMSARNKLRFLAGEFCETMANALFTYENIETYRHIKGELPEFLRVVVGVDPSGAADEKSTADAIGIVVGALGTDGRAYLLEDLTVTAGPVVWGRVATTAYDRHQADCVVGEINFGGAMVEHVIQTSRPRTPFKKVTASRGKHIRAEPISSLYEEGKVVHVGNFPELEEELTAFSTTGYMGDSSPNRADAWVWVLAELFQGIVAPRKKKVQPYIAPFRPSVSGMGY